VRHVREAVRFSECVETALTSGVNVFLECGPQAVLSALVRGCAGEARALVSITSLRKAHEERGALLRALSELHVHGARLDWRSLVSEGARAELPTYAFQRERYWWESKARRTDVRSAGLSASEHPLLGAAISLGSGEGALFTGLLSLPAHAWLADHQIFERVLFPGTGMVELALAAGDALQVPVLSELTGCACSCRWQRPMAAVGAR
jgi:acyl transferase domain-containing protein